MLSDFWTFWFGVLQSIGGIATAIALILVGIQMYYGKIQSEATKEQLKMSRIEQNFTLRPWIYRDPEPSDTSNSKVPNYKVVEDQEPGINEYCIRVPFHNQGRFHTNSLVYYHMFKDNLDEGKLSDQELDEIKKEVKTKYKETSNRVIVPGRLEKLITDYDGSPTKSKADLPMLKPPATSMMKDTLKNTVKSMTKGTENPTAEETEIRNIKEDAIIENAEIIAYKVCSQLAGKLNAQDAISVCQQNTEEEVSMFNWIMTSTPSMVNQLWPKIESSITTNSEL